MWEAPGGGFWFPRWIRVAVLSREDSKCQVTALYWNTDPFDVAIRRCSCGVEFGVLGRGLPAHCGSCDRERLAERQRERRKERRKSTLQVRCVNCGSELSAQRGTRKYCSGRCRTAASRSRPLTAKGKNHMTPRRMIFWRGIDPGSVSKIGTADGSLAGLDVGNTILLRSEAGEAERTVMAVRVDGLYIELFFAPRLPSQTE